MSLQYDSSFSVQKIEIFFLGIMPHSPLWSCSNNHAWWKFQQKKNKNQYVFVKYFCTASGIKVSSIFYSFCNITFWPIIQGVKKKKNDIHFYLLKKIKMRALKENLYYTFCKNIFKRRTIASNLRETYK